MQMGGKQQNGKPPLPDRTKTSAAWSFLPQLPSFYCFSSSATLPPPHWGKGVFQIATPACFHVFMEQLHLSNVKRKIREKGMKNTDIVSSVTGLGAVSGQSTGQTARTPLFSEHQKLILIARLVVMSQMRTALTCAWTHQMKWSCSLSCRRQTVESLRINQAHQEASAPSSTLTPRKCWIEAVCSATDKDPWCRPASTTHSII